MGGGGSGGSTDILMNQPSKVKPQVGNWYNFGINKYETGLPLKDPLLSKAYQGAQDFYGQLPGMLKQFPGFGQEIQGYQDQLGAGLNAPGGAAETAASGGALGPGMLRDIQQQLRTRDAAGGTLHTSGSAASEILGTEEGRQQNYYRALQAEQGALGQQANFTGQRANLLGQEQAVQTGGQNQLLQPLLSGVQAAAASAFPFLNVLTGLLHGNQEASAEQARISAQQQAAGQSKTAGGISAGGSVLAAAIPVVATAL